MKKLLVCAFVPLLLAACSSNDNYYRTVSGDDDTSYLADVKGCPKVHIRNKDFRVIQSEAAVPLFEIEAVGYEGYCYYNDKVEKNKAVIVPKFKITRLGASDVDRVHFSYYLETAEGPAKYLGRKTYFAEAAIAPNNKVTYFEDKRIELTIPERGKLNLDVYMGLNARKSDSESKN